MNNEEAHAERADGTGRVARVGSALLWYALPGVAVATVVAYIAAAIALGVNPPVVPVEGVSMRPTLQAGDLVFLKGVDPTTLRKGDVIAVHVPKASQEQYHLPGSVVHRIVKIAHTPTGLTFQTKGDANSGPDVFKVRSGDIVGEMVGHVRGLGYPILFFRSTQGEIFLGAAALVALIYFLIGLFEERHEYVAGTTTGLQAILTETEELKRLIERVEPVGGLPGETERRANAPHGPSPGPLEPPIAQLRDQVQTSSELSRETNETMRELVGAIGEYGEHLRSHTAVMQGLAATTRNLERVTGELAGASRPAVEERPAARDSQHRPGPAVLPSRRPKMLTNVLAELRSPSLKRAFRGYSAGSVERLLAQAAAALEDTLAEHQQLHSRLEAAEQQLPHYRQLEADMTQALLAAERNANELTERLQRQTERVLEEVRTTASEIVQRAVQDALGERRPAPTEPRAATGAPPVTPSPPAEDRSLRAMLWRARASWRAATAPPSAGAPEDRAAGR